MERAGVYDHSTILFENSSLNLFQLESVPLKDWVFEFKASECQLAVACLACLKKAESAYDLHDY